jgi:hypothetical protein
MLRLLPLLCMAAFGLVVGCQRPAPSYPIISTLVSQNKAHKLIQNADLLYSIDRKYNTCYDPTISLWSDSNIVNIDTMFDTLVYYVVAPQYYNRQSEIPSLATSFYLKELPGYGTLKDYWVTFLTTPRRELIAIGAILICDTTPKKPYTGGLDYAVYKPHYRKNKDGIEFSCSMDDNGIKPQIKWFTIMDSAFDLNQYVIKSRTTKASPDEIKRNFAAFKYNCTVDDNECPALIDFMRDSLKIKGMNSYSHIETMLTNLYNDEKVFIWTKFKTANDTITVAAYSSYGCQISFAEVLSLNGKPK